LAHGRPFENKAIHGRNIKGKTMNRYLARQPILDTDQSLFAYEILSRFGPENYCRVEARADSHTTAMDELFLMGLKRITHGRPAFLNCTREFLFGDYLEMLPKEFVVGEIIDTVEPDEGVLAACHRLKEKGYRLALDDYEDRPEVQPFLEVVDFIKVDFLTTPAEKLKRLAGKFRNWGIPLIAEKVETQEQFENGVEMGYEYFQGCFFCRPQMVSRKSVPANRAMYLRLLQAANRPQLDRTEIAGLMKQDASLNYRLLRYLNSPAFPLLNEVHSIPHALSLLGERATRRWVSLVCVAEMGEGKSEELVKMPLLRARFCELLGEAAGMTGETNDLFLLGLLSMMDILLEMPMAEVLADLPVNEELKKALLGRSGRYARVLEAALIYETGTWNQLTESALALGVHENAIPELHLRAVEWAGQVFAWSPKPVNQ
jgi:c-di-GMP-related signal transduction protein